jgi:hypothetical protein
VEDAKNIAQITTSTMASLPSMKQLCLSLLYLLLLTSGRKSTAAQHNKCTAESSMSVTAQIEKFGNHGDPGGSINHDEKQRVDSRSMEACSLSLLHTKRQPLVEN